MLDWVVEVRRTPCVVCRRSTHGALIARRPPPTALEVVSCGTCGSLTIVGADADVPADEAGIDAYVEYGANVEALVANLYRGRGPTTESMLDIGCGFGFAVAFAERRLGWDAVGIDPGTEAVRGARELNLDLRSETFRPDIDLGRSFDLVVASEILEHVVDPRRFVEAARSCVAADGRLVVTTPDAACVTPSKVAASSQAVGYGGHLTLFSAGALRSLLAEAGFGSVAVETSGDSLIAVAAVAEGVPLATAAAGPTDEDLDAFYADLVARTDPSSALGLGVRARRFAAAVAQGRWDLATTCEAAAFESLGSRYGADLGRPPDVDPAAGSGVLLMIAHAAALARLAQGVDTDLVLSLFDLCEEAARCLAATATGLDGGGNTLIESVRRNRAIAVARVDPGNAPDAARALVDELGPERSAEWVTRVFCELALRGEFEAAVDLAPDAILGLARLPDDAAGVRTALNAARSLALIASGRQERWTALGWIGFEEDLLAERGPALFDLTEVATRGADLTALRNAVVDLDDSVITSLSPSISPDDEALLWSSARGAEPVGAGGAERVSVVVSLYNGRDHIERAVRSALAQTLAPLEVIVVDDGSTDGGAEALATIDSLVPITLIRRPNGGQSSARNVGIRAARGAFVAFLDQDDEWRPDHLRTLHGEMSSDGELAWVFSDFDTVDSHGNTIVRHYIADTRVPHPRNSIARVIAADIMALPSASLIRRSALIGVRGFDRRLVGYEDDDLFVRLYRSGWTYGHVAASTVRYRTHGGGASSSALFLRSRLQFLENLLRAIPDDHHLGLYLSAEFVFPRFFRATLRDYTRAVAFRQFDRARVVLGALEHIDRIDPRKASWRRRLGLSLMRNPASYRRFIRLIERMPESLRPRVDPDLLLSTTARTARRQKTRDR